MADAAASEPSPTQVARHAVGGLEDIGGVEIGRRNPARQPREPQIDVLQGVLDIGGREEATQVQTQSRVKPLHQLGHDRDRRIGGLS